jgi:hypothetical protein
METMETVETDFANTLEYLQKSVSTWLSPLETAKSSGDNGTFKIPQSSQVLNLTGRGLNDHSGILKI